MSFPPPRDLMIRYPRKTLPMRKPKTYRKILRQSLNEEIIDAIWGKFGKSLGDSAPELECPTQVKLSRSHIKVKISIDILVGLM